MQRLALKDFAFSDGTTIPAGQTVAVPGYALHHDGVRVLLPLILGGSLIHFSSQTIYDNPDEFDGFRFAKLREDEYDGVTKYQMANTARDYVPFSHGKHAWYVAICHKFTPLICLAHVALVGSSQLLN